MNFPENDYFRKDIQKCGHCIFFLEYKCFPRHDYYTFIVSMENVWDDIRWPENDWEISIYVLKA